MMVMIGDITKKAIIATLDEEGSEDSMGTKDIFDDMTLMRYLKKKEVTTTISSKERY
jgi:hypothetical protein